MKTLPRALGLSLASLALPAQQAFACAICFSGRDEGRVAYLLTTIFMTSIPLLALGAGIYWVVKKASAAEQGGAKRR